MINHEHVTISAQCTFQGSSLFAPPMAKMPQEDEQVSVCRSQDLLKLGLRERGYVDMDMYVAGPY